MGRIQYPLYEFENNLPTIILLLDQKMGPRKLRLMEFATLANDWMLLYSAHTNDDISTVVHYILVMVLSQWTS